MGPPLHKRPYLGGRPLWMGASSTHETLSGQKDFCEWPMGASATQKTLSRRRQEVLSRWRLPLRRSHYLSRRPSLNRRPPLHKRPYLGRRPSLNWKPTLHKSEEALPGQNTLSEWKASSTQEALSGQKALSEWGGPPLHKRPYLGRSQEASSGR